MRKSMFYTLFLDVFVVIMCSVLFFTCGLLGYMLYVMYPNNVDIPQTIKNEHELTDPKGTDHAIWGYVTQDGTTPVQDGTPVNVVVYHSGNSYIYPVTGGTTNGYYTKTLPGSEQGSKWNVSDIVWVNVTYGGYIFSNQSVISSGTDQRIDVTNVIPEYHLVLLPVIGVVVIYYSVARKK